MNVKRLHYKLLHIVIIDRKYYLERAGLVNLTITEFNRWVRGQQNNNFLECPECPDFKDFDKGNGVRIFNKYLNDFRSISNGKPLLFMFDAIDYLAEQQIDLSVTFFSLLVSSINAA